MRADVTGPSARRTLGSVCAAAAAIVRSDEAGFSVLVTELRSVAPVEDIVDAALLASAEIFSEIADRRNISARRLAVILSHALTELGSPTYAEAMTLLAQYLDDDFTAFSDGCADLVTSTDSDLLVRSCLEVLAGAIRWRAKDRDVPADQAAQALCLSVARFSQAD